MTLMHVAAFTPVSAMAGGILIGTAAIVLMATLGRIAGISGMLSRLLPPYDDQALAIRAAFIAGLLSAPLIAALGGAPVNVEVTDNSALLVAAGLLVGFGSVMGGGCTSGHGICGMARLSSRSITATLVFMGIAIATTFVMRHGLAG